MKGILIKIASKRPLPSAISGGGGGGKGVPMSMWAHCWTLFLNALFWNAFSNAIFEPSDAILELLGTYFGALWVLFLSF